MALNTLDVWILKPKEAFNLIINPSFELATTYWGTSNSAVARVLTYARRGKYSLEVTPNAGVVGGVTYNSLTVTNLATYTLSADIRAAAGTVIELQVRRADLSIVGNKTFTCNGNWQRFALTYAENESAVNHIAYIVRNTPTTTAKFYVDGVQFEAGNESSYFDGDSLGYYPTLQDYRWVGAAHASQSWRSGLTKNGGEMVNLKTYGTILGLIGLGMAPVQNISAPWRLYGADFQKTKVNTRNFVIPLQVGDNVNFTGLQNARKPLIDLVRPDAGYSDQPIMVMMEGKDENGVASTERLEIPCFYSSGLEGEITNQRGEMVNLTFEAFKPLLLSDGEHAVQLVGSVTLTANYALHRDAYGNWDTMNIASVGSFSQIFKFLKTADGTLYASGWFSSINSVANTYGIAKYDGLSWTALGTGLQTGGARIYMTLGPDGNLYVGGGFASAGSQANTANLAMWNGSTWSSIATGGANGAVTALKFSPTGELYIAGGFTTVGGVSANGLAKRSAAGVWSAIGTGINNTAEFFEFVDGTRFFLGGTFATVNGNASLYSCVFYNGTDFIPVIISASANVGRPQYMFWDGATNRLYYSGSWTTLNGINCAGFGYFGQVLSGSTVFTPLANYVNAGSTWALYFMAKQPDGSLLLGGSYTASPFVINGVSLPDGMMTFRGGQFYPFEGNLPGTAVLYAGLIDPKTTEIYISFNQTGSAVLSKTTGVTPVNNFSSARTFPRFVFTGPGTVVKIANETTGQEITFNNLVLSDKEVAILAFSQSGPSFVSNFRGSLQSFIVPGSATDFYLQPGTNYINVFIYGTSGNSDLTVFYQDAFWSFDGGQR